MCCHELILIDLPSDNVLISDNSRVRKNYFLNRVIVLTLNTQNQLSGCHMFTTSLDDVELYYLPSQEITRKNYRKQETEISYQKERKRLVFFYSLPPHPSLLPPSLVIFIPKCHFYFLIPELQRNRSNNCCIS